VIGSRGRARWVARRAAPLLTATERQIIEVNDGIRLEARISMQPRPAPAVVLIHGWLGHADSNYVLSAGAELWNAGFSVFRLNLRDHGNTAHLNEELFHSARIDEVVNAIVELKSSQQVGPVGLAGFSLGGNFALRVARAIRAETVAICPAIDPAATMISIDSGLALYRWFFVRKWHRALREKEQAYPDRYRFDRARSLRTVSDLTDLFVRDHTSYPSTEDYFAAYSLAGSALEGTSATVLYAEDDPVIPASGFRELPGSLTLAASTHGGHCGFVEHPARATWADRFLVDHFSERLFS
jgi:predicted alpha/beta-fold hydrolase